MTVRTKQAVEWILLTFTLPTQRASQRVDLWRKLQRYGTVSLGNSGYLLPSTSANEERFQWLANAIRKYGGEASLVHVKSIDNVSAPRLIARFSEARGRDYDELAQKLQEYASLPAEGRSAGRLSRLRSRFHEIVEVDFFASPAKMRVQKMLDRADLPPASKGARGKTNPADYKGRVWVTRPRPGVDRCASAWLIRRFIDAKARFAFAAESRVPKGGVPFDMFHEEGFGHRGGDCTFETLEKEFGLRDPRIRTLGQIVHDADLLDDRFGRREGYGIDEVLKGWALQRMPDGKLLERGMELFEGLYHAQAK
jgi:hypothetical protein